MKLIDKKLAIRIAVIAVLTASIAFLFFNENGVVKFLKMKNELNQLNEEILKAEEKLKILDSEIDSLKTKDKKIEKVAREKFDMMRKNEKAFKIEEK